MATKICTKCNIEKDFADFSRAKNGKFRLFSSCKVCQHKHYMDNRQRIIERARIYAVKNKDVTLAYGKKYREENRDKALEQNKKYYEENKEELLVRGKQYRDQNKDSIKLRDREYRLKNLDKRRQDCRQYYQNNRESMLAYLKEYRKLNAEKIKELTRLYYLQNKHVSIAWAAKRRALLRKAIPPWVDLEKIKEIYKQARDLTVSTGIQYVVDHILPLNGKTVTGLHVHENLRVITWKENASKGNRLIEELL